MERDPFKLRAVFEAKRRGQEQDRQQDRQVKVCDVCGQAFATTDLDEVFHHGPEPHAPSATRPEAAGCRPNASQHQASAGAS